MASIAFGIDPTGRAGTGAERLDLTGPVDAGERLGHLAPVRVLDADENDFLHEQISPDWPAVRRVTRSTSLDLPWLRSLTSSMRHKP